ncbi:IF-2B-domain-containing protein [Hanseniaspora valbyensis NRRL Y-1626]|uniref:Translation initiation factor eIF2B subunit delta n=1 Tax=Hanseniaspora valbyensis NRRL Y-1626 TaxID=766949 RepID=A0A1B7TDF8_9ASCO|nr:IF-2B-domain-containing protein [Hanseniaspora valbyensis NRRL Y-1626]
MSESTNTETPSTVQEEIKEKEPVVSSNNEISSEPPAGLSNKELKEWKKKEKAAKRLAKKAQQSGQTVQEKENEAILLKEKKQQQKLLQIQQEKIRVQKQKIKQEQEAIAKKKKLEAQKERMLNSSQKSNLFGHLETAQERKSSLLALSSVITSSKFGKITAQGLALPSLSYLSDKSISHTVSSSSGKITEHSDLNESTNSADYLVNLSTILPSSVKKDLDTHTNELSSQLKDLIITIDIIHPSVLKLTDSYASYKIVGSTPRCLALIDAFKDLVLDYTTPPGTVLNRSLTQYLSHQIDFLIKSRPLSVSMGNFIRWFKQRISVLGITGDKDNEKSNSSKNLKRKKTEDELKEELIEDMETFKNEKILVAQQVIVNTASQHVPDGGCVITYGYSQVLFELFKHAKLTEKKNFKIIVIDSRPLFEGKRFVEDLQELGFTDVIYSLITSVAYIFDTMSIDCVLLGAHSILSNGFLNSRVGSASLSMTAKYHNIPVIVCCEALKFTNRVQLDSLTFNELADPNDLIDKSEEDSVSIFNNAGSSDGHVLDDSNLINNSNDIQVGVCKNLYKNNLLEQFVSEREYHLKEQQLKKDELNQLNEKENAKGSNQQNNNMSGNNSGSQQQNSNTSSHNGNSQASLKSKSKKSKKNKSISNWENNASLNIFNIMYDLTPPSYISKIITEYGALPPQSVPVILRDYIK